MSQDKIALITGGTGALGSAVVAQLLADGFSCHVTWLLERELSHFTAHERVTLHRVDCSDEEAVTALFATFPRLDASIHIVGGFSMAKLTDTTLADVDKMFRLNTVTTFLCSREAVRTMRRSEAGRIVNVAARPALIPSGGTVAYSASKAAVVSLTQSMAEEVRSEGILINAVAPSTMDTAANRASMPNADFATWPKVEQVAQAIAFLAGPANTLTTATVIPVYGRA